MKTVRDYPFLVQFVRTVGNEQSGGADNLLETAGILLPNYNAKALEEAALALYEDRLWYRVTQGEAYTNHELRECGPLHKMLHLIDFMNECLLIWEGKL